MTRDAPIPLSEAADELGIAHSTLARGVRAGRVPGAVKIGPVWAVTRAGIEHYRAHSLGRPGLPMGAKLQPRQATSRKKETP